MDDDKSEYDVGFGKPPKDRQFVKGQSGNPKGRPKGSRNMQSILSELSSKPVTLTEDGRTRKVPLKEAVLLQMATGAVRGDRHCRQQFLAMMALSEAREDTEGTTDRPNELEEALMEGVMQRALRAHAQSKQLEETTTESAPKEPKDE